MNLVDEVLKATSSVIKVPVEQLSIDSSLGNPVAWDSLAHANLILELENNFNVSFEFNEFENLISIRAIVCSLNDKGVNV